MRCALDVNWRNRVAAGTEGGGARFTARIRLQHTGEAAQVPHRPHAPSSAQGVRPPRILVVDDHPVGRKAMAVLLEPLGAVVAEADSGEPALEAL